MNIKGDEPRIALERGVVQRLDPTIEIVRHVGTARGISVEVVACEEREKILLVLSPSVSGMSILAEGRPVDVDVFARVGTCVLQALDEVVPLLTGEAFRASAQSAGPVRADAVRR